MRSHRLAIGWPIFALVLCAGPGPSSAQHMSRPDLGLSAIKSTDASSPESVFIPVQLGPPSPSPIPSASPLPNETAPAPLRSNPTPAPLPSSSLPTPLSPNSSPNAPRAGTSTARAKITEGDVSPRKKRSTRYSILNHPTRTKGNTERASAVDPETSLPRLPNVFRNCEEPLPWYCNR
jgi:hypothetical protein